MRKTCPGLLIHSHDFTDMCFIYSIEARSDCRNRIFLRGGEMKYVTSLEKEVIKITCKGSIQEKDRSSFLELMKICIESKAKIILFDWTQVTFFDSTGLECLLVFLKTLKPNRGIKFGLILTEAELVSAYRTLNFDKLIPIFMSLQEAYKAMVPVESAQTL
jgi:anti-anti-sigma factor